MKKYELLEEAVTLDRLQRDIIGYVDKLQYADKEISRLKSQLDKATTNLQLMDKELDNTHGKWVTAHSQLAKVTAIARESLERIQLSNDHDNDCERFSDCCRCMDRSVYGEHGMVKFARAKQKELDQILGEG